MKTVAIQGIRGSYSEEAAMKMLGGSAELIECGDFASAVEMVVGTRCDAAVLPLRNAIVGEIVSVRELLRANEVEVAEEMDLDIDHVLAGGRGGDLSTIEVVHSHPEALRQCGGFFRQHPAIEQIAARDTASSIRLVASQNDRRHAAIGSRRAARMYGAVVLRHGIADVVPNKTVFGLVIRKH